MDKVYRTRAAAVDDLERIVALDRGMETLPHWRVADYLAALSPLRREARMPGTSRCMFVAELRADADLVGFAVGKAAVIEAEAIAELESVGVDERARRSGVGRALCMAVIEWSQRMGAKQIELEVRSRSAGPIALYEGLGFVAEGRRPGYYHDPADDAILMRLDLASHRC